MDTRQLRYFAAVCEFRNLSNAANHCNTAASALSHHIGRLEAELEAKLFVRKPRGMELTAAGLRLLKHTRYILNAVETVASDIKNGQAEVSGEISIGMPFSVIRIVGGALLRRMLEDFPKVNLIIHEGQSGVTYDAIRCGSIEVALIFNPPLDPLTLQKPLVEEEIFCIGDSKIVGEGADPISLEEMMRLPVALIPSGTQFRASVDRPADLARLEAQARIRLASIAATIDAMKEGLACALVPKVLVSEELQRGDLVARKVANARLKQTLYLVSPLEAQPTFLRETVSEVVSGLVKTAVTSGAWEGAKIIEPTQPG